MLAIGTALLSVAIVLAEATISPYLPNLSIFSWALHKTSGNELATELLTFVSLVRFALPECHLVVMPASTLSELGIGVSPGASEVQMYRVSSPASEADMKNG